MATLPPPVRTTAPPADANACPSCGAAMAGAYCHACGERRRTPEEMSARHFFRELADDVFDVDSRVVRSLRLLLFRPGFLTLEYIAGRRKPYLGPLRMYLTVFAATLFFALLVPQTAPPQRSGLVDSFRRLVQWVAERRGMTEAAAERAINQATAQHLAWLSVLIPLLFAVFLYVVFHRRRRWFGEHLVFATHFATVNFLAGLILIPFQLLSLRLAGSTLWVSVAVLVPLFAYTVAAVRRVYGTGTKGSVAAALGIFIVFSIGQAVTALIALATAVFKIAYLGMIPDDARDPVEMVDGDESR